MLVEGALLQGRRWEAGVTERCGNYKCILTGRGENTKKGTNHDIETDETGGAGRTE